MTLASIPLMDRAGRRTLHLYGLGGMFIFSIFITISFLIKASSIQMTFIHELIAFVTQNSRSIQARNIKDRNIVHKSKFDQAPLTMQYFHGMLFHP